MKIYQSLADASLYRIVALIPEQIVFGLALATDRTHRASDETRRNLELGREFCEVFHHVSQRGEGYRATNGSTATIAAGIQELPAANLWEWHDRMFLVKGVIEGLLAGAETENQKLEAANEILLGFAAFAKQTLSSVSAAEDLQRAR